MVNKSSQERRSRNEGCGTSRKQEGGGSHQKSVSDDSVLMADKPIKRQRLYSWREGNSSPVRPHSTSSRGSATRRLGHRVLPRAGWHGQEPGPCTLLPGDRAHVAGHESWNKDRKARHANTHHGMPVSLTSKETGSEAGSGHWVPRGSVPLSRRAALPCEPRPAGRCTWARPSGGGRVHGRGL